MKRRDFILASGSTVLSGLVASGIQRPAVGLDFEISTPNKDPSKVDSLVIEFETLEIAPRYLDEKEPVNVQAKVEVANQTKRSNEVQTSVINGRTKNLENSIDSVVVDGLNTSSSISGDVTVSIEHPDIQDSYSRQFKINSTGIPESGVARYTFDNSDTSGSTAIDSWNNNDGTINGATTGSSGSNQTYTTNESYSFDGVNDTVTTPISGNSLPVTISFWFKWSGNNPDVYPGRVYSIETDGGGNSVLQTNTNNHIVNFFDGNNNNQIDFTANAGIWLFCTHIITESEHIVYRDGGFVNRLSVSASNQSITDLRIGDDVNGDNQYEGKVDDVRVYGRVLTSKEVSNLYNTGRI